MDEEKKKNQPGNQDWNDAQQNNINSEAPVNKIRSSPPLFLVIIMLSFWIFLAIFLIIRFT
ncbi:hypothetical protein A2Y99_03570 [Candidatus Gottesmanbacteria bacterium RBG_13_37_7]|uniref:Uncharacterized protein n=1 Tax=Candidatus Gottesmanbacteria bacterium RBG_13_37_7 TaxID=1798369 RepID=A0A1F5YJY8_9BACT|nr:MAG: hypothetical protein A2Y99_03570 [Candidatus Gottesmanbacteria bacterium RBG_13_37_7]